jgi:uncharacterized protein YukE
MAFIEDGGSDAITGDSFTIKQMDVSPISTSGMSATQIEGMFRQLNPEYIAAAGEAHTRASQALAAIADSVVTHVQKLNGNWKGQAATAAVAAFQQLHTAASSLAETSAQTGAVLSHLGNNVLPSYQSWTAASPGAVQDVEDFFTGNNPQNSAAQKQMNNLNDEITAANANLPATAGIKLPKVSSVKSGSQLSSGIGAGAVGTGAVATGVASRVAPTGIPGTGGVRPGKTSVGDGDTPPGLHTDPAPGEPVGVSSAHPTGDPGAPDPVTTGSHGPGTPSDLPPGEIIPTPGTPGAPAPDPANGDVPDPGGIPGSKLPGVSDSSVPGEEVPSGPGVPGDAPGTVPGSVPVDDSSVPGDNLPVGELPGTSPGVPFTGGGLPGETPGDTLVNTNPYSFGSGVGQDLDDALPGEGAFGSDGMIGVPGESFSAGAFPGASDGVGTSSFTDGAFANGSAAGSTTDAAAADGDGGFGFPMGAGGSGKRDEQDRNRDAWMNEDADVWTGGSDAVPSLIEH